MKFKKIYTLGLGLLIAGMSAVNAQTQDNEKIFYRMDRVKANNPWTKSLNYAGLTFGHNSGKKINLPSNPSFTTQITTCSVIAPHTTVAGTHKLGLKAFTRKECTVSTLPNSNKY